MEVWKGGELNDRDQIAFVCSTLHPTSPSWGTTRKEMWGISACGKSSGGGEREVPLQLSVLVSVGAGKVTNFGLTRRLR